MDFFRQFMQITLTPIQSACIEPNANKLNASINKRSYQNDLELGVQLLAVAPFYLFLRSFCFVLIFQNQNLISPPPSAVYALKRVIIDIFI